MSDSDETNVLLLIPPDFFINADEADNLSEFAFKSIATADGKLLPNALEAKKNIYTFSSNVSDKMNYNNNSQFSHSTPKQPYKYGSSYNPSYEPTNHNFIHEIDCFLQKEKVPSSGDASNKQTMPSDGVPLTYERHVMPPTTSHQNYDFRKNTTTTTTEYLSDLACSPTKKYTTTVATNNPPNDQLMSLSNIWGTHGTSESVTLQEERLRRQVRFEFFFIR